MGYSNVEDRRKYDREWRRKSRAEKRAAAAQQGQNGAQGDQPQPDDTKWCDQEHLKQIPSYVIILLIISLITSGISLWLSWDTVSRFNSIFYP